MDASGFALPPGSLLGNYKLLKALAQGGFGITYIAWDSQLRRNIVLKAVSYTHLTLPTT